jgi:D-alanine-D-alanine ligase
MTTLEWLKKQRVAVLKGGWSSERTISLKTGAAVEAAFRRLGVRVAGIDVKPTTPVDLVRRKINFCFIALHGPFGEDGRLQGCLDMLGIRYTGCGVLASAVAMDKNASKSIFRTAGVPTAPWTVVGKNQRDFSSVKQLLKGGPVFVKPVDQGSAIGVSRVTSLRQWPAAFKKCAATSSDAMVERLIDGREFTVGILGDQALPVVEIVPEHDFYDFHSKYAKGGSKHLVPAPLTAAKAQELQRAALAAFRALGCTVYGRVDVMMDRSGRVNVLEVNTIPGMTSTSLLPDAAKAVGISFDQLVLKIVELSRA